MVNAVAEIDLGIEVNNRAQELGLYGVHELVHDGTHDERLPTSTYIRSNVVCSPAEGVVFEPDELTALLDSVLPKNDDISVGVGQSARFEKSTRLQLPSQKIARPIGVCTITGLVEIEGRTTKEIQEVDELVAEAMVMIAPSRRLADFLIQHPGITFVRPSFLERPFGKSSEEKSGYHKAVKNNLSFWQRIREM